ncbi:serine/threonine-protein kinase Kist isoform X2 [Lepeophtheirus salmonis]|uniref:serine/threonine-protein kinase Kist isoform X2 n=1 Tax=Lepeophtheirus salmonis TaxID=72036 RepID=UPI003AF4093A
MYMHILGVGCCVVFSGEGIRDGSRVALKFYKKGTNYDGAFQREMTILEKYLCGTPNIVLCSGIFSYKGFRIQVLELLESNVRQIIYRNERSGLSPWATQKFAKDILTGLKALHSNKFVHGDLKPANVMWSADDGAFKILDFGLTFHIDEVNLHQIQSSGYRAPESFEWNSYKERLKKKRRCRLQGTYSNLSSIPPSYNVGFDHLDDTFKVNRDPLPSESSGIFTQSTCSNSSLNDVLEEKLPPDTHSGGDQEWRKRDVKVLRRRSAAIYRAPSIPQQPGIPSDIWSFGCLLAEVFTGHKLFKTNDKMVSVLKPHQLVEMKLGPTEISYDESGKNDVFQQVKDLIIRCLESDPSMRITSTDALAHEFITRQDLIPSVKDMVTMPSRVLQFINILDEDLSQEETEAVLNEIREEAEKYGQVTAMRSMGRHAYLEFNEASSAHDACPNLSGKKELLHSSPNHIFMVVFYPLDLWRSKTFL